MKLTDLFSRAMRPHYPGEVEAAARLATRFGNHPGSKAADRSSMAELVRLLKEADDAQTRGGQPALTQGKTIIR